jgi:hypothetical protein
LCRRLTADFLDKKSFELMSFSRPGERHHSRCIVLAVDNDIPLHVAYRIARNRDCPGARGVVVRQTRGRYTKRLWLDQRDEGWQVEGHLNFP